VADETWDALSADIEAFKNALGRSRAVNVNTQALRGSAKHIVKRFFRELRPELTGSGFSDEELEALDAEMQALLVLAQGRNSKASYSRKIGRIKQMLSAVETRREVRYAQRHSSSETGEPDPTERIIIQTLEGLAPSAAASYGQAVADLSATRRSYRGTAVELREALRETLDALAPDGAVTSSDGFKLEKDRKKPTHKQKVRFILRSRQVSKTARAAPEGNVDLIEELTGSLTRATYERGSLATHVPPTEGEIRQLKMYVDSVLAELLEIHA
jgi:hypothetical protein